MKKISCFLLVVLMLVVSLVNVEAETYASYKKGDEIYVSVNATTKYKFYVMEDSGTDNDKVVAIYANVFENKYTYEAAGDYIESLEDEWNNVESVSIPTMEDIFGSDVNLTNSFDFTEPSWALSNSAFWTSTEKQEDDSTWVWTLSTTLDGKGNAGIFEATQESWLKPMINVSKSKIVTATSGGNNSKDDVDSPNTGDLSFLILGGALLACAGLTIMSYKKSQA